MKDTYLILSRCSFNYSKMTARLGRIIIYALWAIAFLIASLLLASMYSLPVSHFLEQLVVLNQW